MKSPNKFLSKRKISYSETIFKRVTEYIIFCYLLIIKDNLKISSTEILQTNIKPENYYRNVLLYDYLQKNKSLARFKVISNLHFLAETEVLYRNVNNLSAGKIDIFVTNLGKKLLNGKPSEQVFFNFECKRLNNNLLNNLYVEEGIYRYLKRNYRNHFPFIGLIAFVENGNIIDIINDINNKLSLDRYSSIKNISYLNFHKLVKNFDNSYISRHKNTLGINFNYYHIFFDFQNVLN